MKPFVYVAGPISSDPIHHTRTAIERYVRMLKEDKVVPFCPHLSILVEITSGHAADYELWLKHDFDIIERCDALLRTEGDSPGADREVEFARERGIPVFMSERGLTNWADHWTARRYSGDLSRVDL